MAVAASEPEALPELHIMVAGLPRSGKSTGLNNIFDLKLPAGLSPTPITDSVISVKITRNGISLTITDTPGLKAANANSDKTTLQEMRKIGKNTVLLLLTLSVAHNSSITENYCNILANLSTILGGKVWDWCIVLLTSCDQVRDNEFSSDQNQQAYEDYLKGHCMELQKALTKIGVTKSVCPFFEYTSNEQFESASLDGIVAIPVGKVPEFPTLRLLPGQPWTHNHKWTDLAFTEILKINGEIQLEEDRRIQEANELRFALVQFKHGCITFEDIIQAGKNGAALGAVMGSNAGEILGDIIGAIVGANKKSVGIRQGRELGKLSGEIIGKVGGILSIGGAAAAKLLVQYIIEQRKLISMEKELLQLEHTK